MTNSSTSNLVIEDGAQLVCNNNVAATMTRNIENFTSAGDEGHWYLIASPMTDEYLVSESSLISSTPANYDLYILDQNYDNQEWRNYKQGHFSHIKNKMGYLYASAVNTDVTFSGTLNNTDGEIDLTYVDGHDKTGFNLIGNPYPCNTTIGRDFYRIVDNNGVSELQLASGVIYPMEGVVVEASSNTDKVTFEKALPSSTPNNNDTQSALGINLSQDRGTLDRAIIRFGEGNNLSKMMLHPDNTRIYLEVEDKDYAVACSDGQGEMPVNFKAAEDGQYTISVSTENVEMGYLHLIDNKTNADIDLLSTPSYSFNAKSDDNASRFRLVFKANAVNDITTEGNEFAFLSNGQLIITNEGEATLQVIDITGRMLSTEVISGNYSKALNAAGVYVLRLINGETTKTQKIVVK